MIGPGDVLRQKYRIEQQLGQGGMAVVFAATHLTLQQRVAVKLLKPGSTREPEVIERFLREARAASRLESAHVARVFDVETLDDGTPFIVMELLDGCDLAALVRQRTLAPAEAVGYVREACDAIAEAHALGIIHRDVKPANLFLSRKRTGESVVKVLDFGISKLIEDTRITEVQVGMGSAEYMSPEQMRSAGDVDGRTDVWSLGVTLYELLTGHTPFHADTVGNVLAAVLARPPVPPRQYRPDLSADLEALILRCLEKEPDKRFATVMDLSAALAPFAAPAMPSAFAPARPSFASVPAAASAFAPAPPPSAPARTLLSAHGGPAPAPSIQPAPPSSAQPAPAPPAQPAPAPPAPAPRGFSPMAGVAIGLAALIVVIIAFGLGRGRGSPPADRFKLEADTLIDNQKKLTWQRRPASAAMDWAAARAHCQRVGGGYRLPTTDELQSLLDVTTIEPPLDPESFPTTAIDVFWSGSAAGPGAAWAVHFSNGRTAESAVSARNRVRCVR
ncbi:MAG: protein kinase [Minicystis sp.]